MEKRGMSAAEFTDKFKHENIEHQLQIFARLHRHSMPPELYDAAGKTIIMLDVLKVSGSDIVLPIVTRSTAWLVVSNRLRGDHLLICLHEEFWPFQQRMQLVGGLYEISEKDIVNPIIGYLKCSIEYWDGINIECRICISDRALDIIKNKKGVEPLLEKIQVMNLSEEYKKHDLEFPH